MERKCWSANRVFLALRQSCRTRQFGHEWERPGLPKRFHSVYAKLGVIGGQDEQKVAVGSHGQAAASRCNRRFTALHTIDEILFSASDISLGNGEGASDKVRDVTVIP